MCSVIKNSSGGDFAPADINRIAQSKISKLVLQGFVRGSFFIQFGEASYSVEWQK